MAHEYKIHTYRSYGDYRFIQSRNPPYLHGIEAAKKGRTPPIIEEGKMNMTVSLLIGCNGNIGNQADEFRAMAEKSLLVTTIGRGNHSRYRGNANINFHNPENKRDVRMIIRRILPGFVLRDRSQYLEDYYKEMVEKNPDAELLDAWLDFSALKQKARPKSNLISKHLQELLKKEPDNQQVIQLAECWYKAPGNSLQRWGYTGSVKRLFLWS